VGELVGLRRENIDLDACQIRIVETTAELNRGGLLPETPQSRAGRRTVPFPAELVPELRSHLERFAAPGERGQVFVRPKGAALTCAFWVERAKMPGAGEGEPPWESNPHDQLGRLRLVLL
jgi:integrase